MWINYLKDKLRRCKNEPTELQSGKLKRNLTQDKTGNGIDPQE
jgi:hypothetical protein